MGQGQYLEDGDGAVEEAFPVLLTTVAPGTGQVQFSVLWCELQP